MEILILPEFIASDSQAQFREKGKGEVNSQVPSVCREGQTDTKEQDTGLELEAAGRVECLLPVYVALLPYELPRNLFSQALWA